MIIMNTQLQCSAFTAITAFVIFVTPDVITGNIECTKNISIVSTNSTNNETTNQTANSKVPLKYNYLMIKNYVLFGLIIWLIILPPIVLLVITYYRDIINYIRNSYRNTMYRLRNWRQYFRRNRPEPVVRHELNGGIQIIE